MRLKDCSQVLFFIVLLVGVFFGWWEAIRAIEKMGGDFFLRASGWGLLLISFYFTFEVLDRLGPNDSPLTEVQILGKPTGTMAPLSSVFSNLALPFAFLNLLELIVVDYGLKSQITVLDDGDRLLILAILPVVYLILHAISANGKLREELLYWSALPVGLYYLTGVVYENWDNVGAEQGIYAKYDEQGAVTEKFFWFRVANEDGQTGQEGTFILFLFVYFASSAALTAGFYLFEKALRNLGKKQSQVSYKAMNVANGV